MAKFIQIMWKLFFNFLVSNYWRKLKMFSKVKKSKKFSNKKVALDLNKNFSFLWPYSKSHFLKSYRDPKFIFPYVITEDTLGISGYHGHLHQQSLARNGFLCCRNPKDHFKTETKSMFSYWRYPGYKGAPRASPPTKFSQK